MGTGFTGKPRKRRFQKHQPAPWYIKKNPDGSARYIQRKKNRKGVYNP